MSGKTRIAREKRTVAAMVKLYCRNHHHPAGELCPACTELLTYAHKRLELCKFGENKTTCGKCPVHCYRPEMRKQIIEVMRYAGPKMIFVYPLTAIRHLLDGRKQP